MRHGIHGIAGSWLVETVAPDYFAGESSSSRLNYSWKEGDAIVTRIQIAAVHGAVSFQPISRSINGQTVLQNGAVLSPRMGRNKWRAV